MRLLILLDADDSLESNETVSLNAESLSGLSVRDSRIAPLLESDPLPFPLSDEIEIDEFVTPETVEFDRECVRPLRIGDMIGATTVVAAITAVAGVVVGNGGGG